MAGVVNECPKCGDRCYDMEPCDRCGLSGHEVAEGNAANREAASRRAVSPASDWDAALGKLRQEIDQACRGVLLEDVLENALVALKLHKRELAEGKEVNVLTTRADDPVLFSLVVRLMPHFQVRVEAHESDAGLRVVLVSR